MTIRSNLERPGSVLMLAALVSLGLASGAVAADAKAGRDKAAMCVTCHGLDGVAKAPDAPNLAGTSAFYTSAQLKAFRSGERRHPQMSVIAEGLEDADIADLAAWYASVKIEATMPAE